MDSAPSATAILLSQQCSVMFCKELLKLFVSSSKNLSALCRDFGFWMLDSGFGMPADFSLDLEGRNDNRR